MINKSTVLILLLLTACSTPKEGQQGGGSEQFTGTAGQRMAQPESPEGESRQTIEEQIVRYYFPNGKDWTEIEGETDDDKSKEPQYALPDQKWITIGSPGIDIRPVKEVKTTRTETVIGGSQDYAKILKQWGNAVDKGTMSIVVSSLLMAVISIFVYKGRGGNRNPILGGIGMVGTFAIAYFQAPWIMFGVIIAMIVLWLVKQANPGVL